jgi:hypothetical protein
MSENLPPMPEDLAQLLSDLTDGTLSDGGRDELRLRLADDTQAFDLYCKWMHLDSLLYLDLQHPGDLLIRPPATPASLDASRAERPLLSPRARRWAYGLTAAAGTALAASLAYVMIAPQGAESTRGFARPTSTAIRQPRARIDKFQHTAGDAVAVLSRVAGATLAGAKEPVVGSALSRGRLEIESGLVQLEFLSGANVVVEGPAELELVSTKLVVCRRGKLRVHVPDQAKGFMVDTPHHRTVDLGTEFAVSVAADRSTEVHVLDGEVEMFNMAAGDAPAAVRSHDLFIGDALHTSADGQNEPMPAEPEKFVGVEEILSLSTEDSQSQYSVWRKQTQRWRTEGSVVAFYSFEDHRPWARVLKQDGPSGLPSLDGAIVGCRWAEGRWPGKLALEFKGAEDRVRLNIPGEYESITLSCWIRIGGLDRWLSSIMLTDGHNLGEVHWQFTETGQLLLGVKAVHDRSQEYLSETALQLSDMGRWIHLACVYNHAKKEVAHFVDGKRVGTHPIIKEIPLRFGAAELGNWVPEELKDHRIRSLNGRIDEFMLLDRAMSDAEVQELFEAGKTAA